RAWREPPRSTAYAENSAQRKARRSCWKRSSSPAIAWRSKATIRSRRTFSRRRWRRSIPHESMICTWCNRSSHCPNILMCSNAASQTAWTSPLQSRKLAELVASKALKIGAIHTYLELYARMLVDLTPQVALVVADKADRDGNLYTGPNTEDTPTITEATAFRGGIVVAQVNEVVDRLPRVDVPGDWVDVVVPSPK